MNSGRAKRKCQGRSNEYETDYEGVRVPRGTREDAKVRRRVIGARKSKRSVRKSQGASGRAKRDQQ